MEIYGEVPSGDFILASCDSLYFREHGLAFYNSAMEYENRIHIHVINPSTDDMARLVVLQNRNPVAFTWSAEDCLIKGDPKPYYACNRFLLASYIVRAVPNVRIMITDIDAIFGAKIPFPDRPIGMFLRENETQEIMKVAAGLVYIGHGGADFIHDVARRIHQHANLFWFVDQIALWTAYKDWRDKESIMKFYPEHLDWSYNRKAWLHTGKGPRKYENPRYLDMKRNYER